MDNLEKFILQNREEFDFNEPSPEIWDKIENRKPKSKIITINWKKNILRAASVIIIASITFFIQEYRHRDEVKENTISQNNKNVIIPELKEVEDYYNNEVDRKMKEITKLANYNSEIQQHLETDLAELDSVYFELKNDLNDNIDNEEVVAAMVQNYKVKLQVLEEILYFLEAKNKNKDEKAKEYEL